MLNGGRAADVMSQLAEAIPGSREFASLAARKRMIESQAQRILGRAQESDKLLAPRIANQFLRAAKDFFTVKSKREAVWIDVRTRTKTRLWKTMREDGKAEGFDPGEFTYPPDV